MDFKSLNPQTILYNTDPTMEKYFRAAVDGAVLEQGPGNISEMNRNIFRMFYVIKNDN
jgi:hypothetical protein